MSVAAACDSPASTNPSDYVGEYIFTPTNADPGNFADFVILKSDQTALTLRFDKKTGHVQITRTKWRLSPGTGQEEVDVGDFAHSVEVSGSVIKLGNNLDLGQYYEKVR